MDIKERMANVGMTQVDMILELQKRGYAVQPPMMSSILRGVYTYPKAKQIENHAQVLYEVNVYSNKTSGKKTECKAIIALIDSKMEALGFTRTLMNPVPNEEDATVYRMVARYRAIVSKNKTIYRR